MSIARQLEDYEVSIVIAHNPNRGGYYLDRCLASLEGYSYKKIIADDGSKSESRNRAVQKSTSALIVFIDDDVVIRKGAIEELLQPFKDRKVGIVGGVNIAFSNISFMEQVASTLYASPFAMFKSCARWTPRGDIREADESELILCFMAVRRRAFIEAGGFPLNIIPCEENVLINNVQKLGYKIIYNPFAVVYHRRSKAFMEYWRAIYSYGYGRGRMMKKKLGEPKMLWKPTWKTPFVAITLIGHYISYIIGVIVGYTS